MAFEGDNPFYFGTDQNQNQFNMPTGNDFSFGSDAPQGVWQSGETYRPQQAPEQSLWDRINFNYNTPKGMDNWFNAGAGALGVLQTGLALKDQEDQKKDFRRAENMIRGQMNPNQALFEQRIMSMLDNPSGYLTDPVDNTMAQEATTAAERMAARQGRPGMSMDDLKRIQAVKRSSYDNRLKTLLDLYRNAQSNNSGVASALGSLMQRRPSGSAAPIIGGLQSLYSAGRDIAANSGVASTVRQPAQDKYMTLRLSRDE